ncbi:MAG: AraC family transcriptional regulator [Streptococcaceae bacterium]|jgi:YesN/AraC family two-component response regulator|nr:AraC family transcriptional regulator [Streptococcaceae bacterium]
MKQAARWLLTKHVSINEIANCVGMNHKQFGRLFKKQYDMSPREYKKKFGK